MFGFCKPISSKKRFLPFRVLNEDFSFTLYDQADQVIGKDWDKCAKQKGIFLNRQYLKIIEKSLFTKMLCRYVIVYHKGEACGIIYFQVLDFNTGAFTGLIEEKTLSAHKTTLKNYVNAHQNEVLMRLFTCGNNLISGDYGYCFETTINENMAHSILLEITELIAKEDRLKNIISAILIKDFEQVLKPEKLFKEENYTDFSVEPNMVVHVTPGLNSIEDYIQLFSKKYRNRAKSAFKKFEKVEIIDLNAAEVIKLESTIYSLYEAIFNDAKFRLLKLPVNYFSETKTLFENQFFMKGFFLDNQLIAFYSYFLNENEVVEAHYIGMNYELNQPYCLYQNILYDLIRVSISNKARILNLGRTAGEIKTTVGAVPQNLICYIKPQNTFSKLVQKPFIQLLQPIEYIPRNPFKEEG